MYIEQFNSLTLLLFILGDAYITKYVVMHSYFDISENNGSRTRVQLSNNPWEKWSLLTVNDWFVS